MTWTSHAFAMYCIVLKISLKAPCSFILVQQPTFTQNAAHALLRPNPAELDVSVRSPEYENYNNLILSY